MCTVQNLFTTNEQAIFRVTGTHFTGWKNDDVTHLRILNSNVTFIITRPFFVFPNIRILELHNSRLLKIQQNDFRMAESLRTLSIRQASPNFQTLEANLFNDLIDLESFQFVSNSLVSIDENAFDGLKNLRNLQLQDNLIQFLHRNTFRSLSRLETLQLSNNYLERIDDQLFAANEQLTSLDFTGNRIIDVGQGFIANLTNLTTLRFVDNRCANSNFGASLQFSFNRELIDYELKQCYANVHLPTPIEPEFFNLPCTFALISSNYVCTLQNLITSNDNAIFRVTGTHFTGWANTDVFHLRILNSNVTFIITRLFHVFSKVGILDLHTTRLMRIAQNDFKLATNLRTLSISQASPSFLALEANSFTHLNALETLQFDGSSLSVIDEHAFVGLNNLRNLHLHNNDVRVLHRDTLRPLTNLESFRITNNLIERIDGQQFINNSKLTDLDFSENLIIEVGSIFIDHLTSLRTLRMGANRCSDATFGLNLRYAFDRELIAYELKQCFENVHLQTPIVPEFVNLPCIFGITSSDYTCTMQNVATTNHNAIFRVTGTHFSGWSNRQVVTVRILNLHVSFIISRLFVVFQNLRTLQHDAGLTRILTTDFVGAKNLTTLRVTNGNFSRIDPNAFMFLTELSILEITGSNLVQIDENAFFGLTKLTELNLRSNRITELRPQTLRPLVQLRSLNLGSNELKTISINNFANNTRLEIIDLEVNEIISIEEGFISHLGKLAQLRLQRNGCANANFGPTFLTFRQNNIDHELQFCYSNVGSPNPVVPEIVTMPCQFSLFNSNYVCTIQSVFTSNPNSIIRMTGNHWTGWSNNDVAGIFISNSNITFIVSRVFEVFPTLVTYQHQNGVLAINSRDFVNAGNLRTLTLLTVNLRDLDNEIFQHLSRLRSLSVSSITLRALNNNSFDGLENLENLVLDGSSIVEINSRMLQSLPALRTFSIGFNSLTRLGDGLFSKNNQLESISLQSNAINSISSTFLEPYPSLRSLQLSGNRCVNSNFILSDDQDRTRMNNALASCFNNFRT